MEKSIKISAAIIAFNEKRNIERCISSLKGVADEIVVIDSHSTDETGELAAKAGAIVFRHQFEGYIQQKNYAITKCSHNWVLSLDADEALSEELKRSILETKNNIRGVAYSFNRLSSYCGKWIRHCGWYPDVKVRLFRKNAGSWGGKNPHDKFIVGKDQEVIHLKGDLLHYTYYTVEQHKQQIERFSTISAQAYYDKGIRSNTFKIIFSPVAKFIRNYILKAGFLDGYYGILICVLSAKATYYKYNKLKKIEKSQTL